ncbi:MAG: transcriptional regulator [Meiothermus sp.]|uniref:Transcriptional regulator n=2 Tax=Meiothermus hypogaeus TaxID=884155 RepID=A0A511R1R2_9DEIN|nr:GntR family transcriptional regulator [Meiothermus hypogaeus]RIH80155.1 HTH-type transcriptional repressor YvoA [Meiothermus hypogaeus]GEM83548.1 transcriptional regulator [Meiothermus hypogaeus NBRC 106114]GIW37677.1 MAG: transcriptional regulator [Meiothermus sp.]
MHAKLNTHSATPLYLQLEAVLREALASDTWKAGEAMPPERELANQFGVSRLTLRKALERLEAQGLVQRRQGSGTYVAPRLEQPLSTLTGFSEDMRARGLEPKVRWLKRGLFTASPEEVLALSLSPGEKVARLERVRSAQGEPMAVERAALPAHLLPNPEEVKDSLYAYLESKGLRPVRALQRLRAVAASRQEAELLGIRADEPVLYIERLSYLADGSVLEFTRSHYRGDRYDFVAELRSNR